MTIGRDDMAIGATKDSAGDNRAKRARRLVVFADPCQAAPAVLLPALLETVVQRTDVELAALLLSRPPRVWLQRRIALANRVAQGTLGTGRLDAAARILAGDVLRSTRQYGLPIVVLPGGNPNHRSVLALMRDRSPAQFGVNLYCMRRFEPALLDCFDQCVNYHNGRLPQQRGLRASNWSLYQGEPQSGFTFHRMDTAFDDGAVMLEGEVPVLDRDTPGDLEVRKASAAAARLPLLLDAMLRGDTGQPQDGAASYRSAADYEHIRRVPDPSSLTADEWLRRLKGFVRIETHLDGGWVAVTGLIVGPARRGLGFLTADRQWMRITSIDFLPTWMQRLNGRKN